MVFFRKFNTLLIDFSLCYFLRLQKTGEIARKEGFDYFGTTLTVSPYKNSDVINSIPPKNKVHNNYAIKAFFYLEIFQFLFALKHHNLLSLFIILFYFLLDLGITLRDIDYDHDSFLKVSKHLETEPEGGARCHKCLFHQTKNRLKDKYLICQYNNE